MHVVVAWNITSASHEKQEEEITKSLREAFGGRPWLSPLARFHIVKVAGSEDRDKIQTAMVELVKVFNEGRDINFIISPVMPSGTNYSGWLPTDWWPKVRGLTS